jgi:C_GCAxxG_C_C family probable redox protein
MDHELQAAQLFLDGYNCAQAITVAFSDVTGLDKHLSATLASSFGGGMGRMGEVCGAVSGMLMVAGVLYGYDADQDDDAKKAHYALVRELAGKFREEADSILCRDLLSNLSSDPNPAPRYAEFYKARPCARFVMLAARILDAYIAAHPVG